MDRAGEKDRRALAPVSARPLRALRLAGDGETSLMASWAAVKAMLTPGPIDRPTEMRTQKAVREAGVPIRSTALKNGIMAMKNG